ncbi:MAG: 50S ribosomal protein L10, partial [Thermodesulfobacteriota bacterium]
ERIVSELNDKFSKSKVVIVTDYQGLNVSAINELRRKLRSAGIEYRVAKNTLLIRASEGTEISLIKDRFKGPSAVALGFEDPVAPAKVLTEFADQNNKLEIKIGVLKGKILELKDIRALATLPNREILLAQLLSVMKGTPAALVRALNHIPAKLVYALNAIKEKKEAA